MQAEWSSPFGMLPMSSQDKPALLVDGFKAGLKTPAAPPGTNAQTMKTRMRINDDGSVTGEVDVTLKGMYAADSRASLRNLSKENAEELVKNVLQGQGYVGKGRFDKDDPTALIDTFHYKANVEFKNFTQLPGAGAFAVRPVFYSNAPVAHFASAGLDDSETMDAFACSNGETLEEYVITFPKKMKVLAVPENMTLSSPNLTYKSTYKLKGNQLTVMRRVDDHTRGNVCAPAIAEEYKRFATKVLQDIKAQVVYK